MANAVFCCGRMNPPTIGHTKVVLKMDEFAAKHDAKTFVFSTRSNDPERNPLSPDEKRDFLSRAFGRDVVLTKSPMTAVELLVEAGIKKATFFVGEDRRAMAMAVSEFGQMLGIEITAEIIQRDIDDVSATEVRNTALEGDYKTFCTLVSNPDQNFQFELYHAVRRGMGVEDGIVRESFG